MRWVQYIWLSFLLGVLVACSNPSNQKKTPAHFVPQNANQVLKIKQWQTTLNDFNEHPVMKQLAEESFSNLFTLHQPLFNALDFNNEVLFASEKKGDSSTVFTLISEGTEGIQLIDSLLQEKGKEIPFEQWTLQQFPFEDQSYYQVISDSIRILSNSEKNLQEVLRSEKKQDSTFQKAFKVKQPESLVYVSKLAQDPSSLAAATAFELKLMADGMAANGVVLDTDATSQWITLFKGQIPQPIESQHIIPNSAQKATIITLSDIASFENRLQIFRKDSLLTLPSYFETATEIVEIRDNNQRTFAVKSLDVDLAQESLLAMITEKEAFREVPILSLIHI